jgi:hypothetical protein
VPSNPIEDSPVSSHAACLRRSRKGPRPAIVCDHAQRRTFQPQRARDRETSLTTPRRHGVVTVQPSAMGTMHAWPCEPRSRTTVAVQRATGRGWPLSGVRTSTSPGRRTVEAASCAVRSKAASASRLERRAPLPWTHACGRTCAGDLGTGPRRGWCRGPCPAGRRRAAAPLASARGHRRGLLAALRPGGALQRPAARPMLLCQRPMRTARSLAHTLS